MAEFLMETIVKSQKRTGILKPCLRYSGCSLHTPYCSPGQGFQVSVILYAYLASGNTSFCFPIKSYIPLDLSTHTLLSFITKVCTHVQFKCLLITIHYKTVIHIFVQIEEAQSNEDIGSIVDEPDNLAVLNASSWNVIDPVTMRNKLSFVQRLVKREINLKAFRQGLTSHEFFESCCQISVPHAAIFCCRGVI